MKVLIVGGTGQISTSLSWTLTRAGHEVTAFNRGRRQVALPAGVRVLRSDRDEPGALEAAARETSYDAVIDFICWNGEQARSDVEAFSGRCGHFIYVSTVWVYGPPGTFPVTEDHPCNPADAYAKSKRDAEIVFAQAADDRTFPVTTVRFHATYNDHSAWPSILQPDGTVPYRLLAGKPLLIHDRGVLPTHFLHADDAAAGLLGLIQRPEQSRRRSFNLVGESLTWRSVFDRLAEVFGVVPSYASVAAEIVIDAFPDRSWPLSGVHQFAMCISNDTIRSVVPEFAVSVSVSEGFRRRLRLAGLEPPYVLEDPDPDLTRSIDELILSERIRSRR